MLRVTIALFALAACASDGDDAEAREAAYQQCLKDSQPVAMSWEAIEEMCRERTGAENKLE